MNSNTSHAATAANPIPVTNPVPANNPSDITVSTLLDFWMNRECKPGALSNGTLSAYQCIVQRIRRHAFAARPVQEITSQEIQNFLEEVRRSNPSSYDSSFIHESLPPDDATMQFCPKAKPLSQGYMLQYLAVMKGAFQFAVYPAGLLTNNPMQDVRLQFRDCCRDVLDKNPFPASLQTITHAQYLQLTATLAAQGSAALLPVQIAYYTGLRIGEVCALTWQDIHLQERCLIVRRSLRYNGMQHCTELSGPKRGRTRIVEFGETLYQILLQASAEHQTRHRKQLRNLEKDAVKTVTEGNRVYNEVHRIPPGSPVPASWQEMAFVCSCRTGGGIRPNAIRQACRKAAAQMEDMEGFHFHTLRHTYASNLIRGGAPPTEVSELLGHQSVSTTLAIYAHATRQARQSSARILDTLCDNID